MNFVSQKWEILVFEHAYENKWQSKHAAMNLLIKKKNPNTDDRNDSKKIIVAAKLLYHIHGWIYINPNTDDRMDTKNHFGHKTTLSDTHCWMYIIKLSGR